MATFEETPLHELLLTILDHTSTDVIDELWPDNETTLADIAQQILNQHAHELAEQQRTHTRKMNDPHGPYRTAIVMTDILTNLIDPPKKRP
jgi:hypothetical protein